MPVASRSGAMVAVSGYASLDHAMATGPFLGAAGTTLVRERLSDPWPGAGGVAHLALALAAAGVRVEAVSWVGDDPGGGAWTGALRDAGVGVGGVAVGAGRSPAAYMLYPPSGETVCVYDPGGPFPKGVDAAQRRLAAECEWLCLAVGPRAASEALLDALPPAAHLTWAVKADPDAFPPALVRRLLARAEVVSWSHGEEAGFLKEAAGDPAALAERALLVETRGSGGVWLRHHGAERVLPVREVAARDTTGAGDTLLGTVVARLATGERDATAAVAAGAEAAARFLELRAGNGGEHA